MDIFENLFDVLWKLAIPVGGLSFGMVWWALKKGVLSETGGVRALSKEIDAMGKRHKDKEQDSPKVNPVHGKWLKFGGGFYGTVALYTYGLIEYADIRQTMVYAQFHPVGLDGGGLRRLLAGYEICSAPI